MTEVAIVCFDTLKGLIERFPQEKIHFEQSQTKLKVYFIIANLSIEDIC